MSIEDIRIRIEASEEWTTITRYEWSEIADHIRSLESDKQQLEERVKEADQKLRDCWKQAINMRVGFEHQTKEAIVLAKNLDELTDSQDATIVYLKSQIADLQQQVRGLREAIGKLKVYDAHSLNDGTNVYSVSVTDIGHARKVAGVKP